MTKKVFPACAGVILSVGLKKAELTGFPRMRGGDPALRLKFYSFQKFSPHARG